MPVEEPCSAALTFSRLNGTERRRMPVASKTAFEIEEDITAAEGSPAPQGFSVGRSIRSITISGTLGKGQDRITRPIEAGDHAAIKGDFLLQRSADGLYDVAFDLRFHASSG